MTDTAEKQKKPQPLTDRPAPPKVRDAGPDAMKDKPVRKWEKEDAESDQSFPASDPPANY